MKRFLHLLFAFLLVFSLTACQTIPAPQITKAEFPFEIVYELDGETITVNDVYVCEFEGFDWNEAVGKHRRWKGYVKSTGKDHVVLLEDGSLKLACSLGSAAYYMDDPSMEGAGEFTPSIYYIRTFESGGVSSGTSGIEKMLEEYKIQLVSWKLSKPIENTFE